MVHPIVILTSFLNSATRKNIQNVYWKLKHYKKIVFLHIVCVFGENGRVRLSEGMYRGVIGFKFQKLMLIHWCYYNPHKINRVSWKNRINNPPYYGLFKVLENLYSSFRHIIRVHTLEHDTSPTGVYTGSDYRLAFRPSVCLSTSGGERCVKFESSKFV